MQHPRNWRQNRYVYPVMSRRARGLSVGINLNPDKACNFDCIYCQVDRGVPPTVRRVDLDVLARELEAMLVWARDGGIYEAPPFDSVPEKYKRLNDMAFSGDGEPTACPHFPQAVRLAGEIKDRLGLASAKLLLITDAAFLHRPKVRDALMVMDRYNGEIWAKLDAGTEAYFKLVNRPNCSLARVVANITAAACVRPLVLQSLWMQIHGEGPSDAEIHAFCDRVNEVQAAGGRIQWVQVYTIARAPAEDYVTALPDERLEAIGRAVRQRTGIPAEVFASASE